MQGLRCKRLHCRRNDRGEYRSTLTMEEIAQKAAVSLTTVSRVIHQPEKVGPGILDRAIPCIRARDIPEGEENYVDFDIMVINRGIREAGGV